MVWKNIFPYRPDEAAMFGCESLSTAYRWVPLKLDFWEHENQSGLLVI